MRLADVDTPALVVDLDAVERNVDRMQARCDALGLALRPHIKTHKLPALAHLQLARGAVGVTCQKLGEAEVMAASGVRDILVSYPILGAAKGNAHAFLTDITTVLATNYVWTGTAYSSTSAAWTKGAPTAFPDTSIWSGTQRRNGCNGPAYAPMSRGRCRMSQMIPICARGAARPR